MKHFTLTLVVALFIATAAHAQQWYYEGVLLRAHDTAAAAAADYASLDPTQKANASILPLRYRTMPLSINQNVVTWALVWQPSQYDDASCLGPMPAFVPSNSWHSGYCTMTVSSPYTASNFTTQSAAKSYFDSLDPDMQLRSGGLLATPLGTWIVIVPTLNIACQTP